MDGALVLRQEWTTGEKARKAKRKGKLPYKTTKMSSYTILILAEGSPVHAYAPLHSEMDDRE